MNEYEELKNGLINSFNVIQDVFIDCFKPKVIYRVYRFKGKKKRRYLFVHNRLLDFIPVLATRMVFRFLRYSLNKKED